MDFSIAKIETSVRDDELIDVDFYFKGAGNEPFSMSEFRPGTSTRVHLEKIIDALYEAQEAHRELKEQA